VSTLECKALPAKPPLKSGAESFRMKQLHEKAAVQQDETPQEMLIVAKQYNIKVFSQSSFLNYLEELLTAPEPITKKRKPEDEIQSPYSKKLKSGTTHLLNTPVTKFKKKAKNLTPHSPAREMAKDKLKHFKEGYIMVEDAYETNLKPIWKEFTQSVETPTGFPVVLYQHTNWSPFLTNPPRDTPDATDTGDTLEIQHSDSGFCHICKINFHTFQEHVACKQHTTQLNQFKLVFESIDSVLAQTATTKKT